MLMNKSEQSVDSPSAKEMPRVDSPLPINERALVWLVDLRLVPVLIVLYLMAFLDRSVSPKYLCTYMPLDAYC